MTVDNVTWETNTKLRHKKWRESSATLGASTIYHSVGDLRANKYYDVMVDNDKFVVTRSIKGIEGTYCSYSYCKANGSGKINFLYAGNYATSHNFDVSLSLRKN
jgi:hypothetical protein